MLPHSMTKPLQRLEVSPDSVILIVAPELNIELLKLPLHGCVHMPPAPLTNFLQAPFQALTHSLAPYQESTPAVLACNVGETQEVECPASRSSGDVPPAAKSYQPGLVPIEAQTMTLQSLLQRLQKLSGFLLPLAGDHQVIGITHDIHLSLRFPFAPLLHKGVYHMVKEDIGQKRRYHRPLRSPALLTLPPCTVRERIYFRKENAALAKSAFRL